MQSPVSAAVGRASRSGSARALFVQAALRDPVLVAAALVLVLVVLSGVAAQWIAPFNPNEQNLNARLQPPFAPTENVSILGSDVLGRDLLSRLIYGARISLVVAVASVLLSGVFGTIIGIVAGFYGRWPDAVLMRIADMQFSIPFLVLALALAAVTRPGLATMIIILAATGWPRFARVMRAEVLRIVTQGYIESARAIGGTDLHLMWRHVLPNAAGVAVVIATVQSAQMILAEASLSFLGVGLPPDIPSWGAMVAAGRTYISSAWWITALPGITIWLTVVALNLVGDWLVDYSDPALRPS